MLYNTPLITCGLPFTVWLIINVCVAQKTPEEFIFKVLSDRYVRNPVMILVEGCSSTVNKAEYIWSKVNQLPNGVILTITSFNATGIGPSIEAVDIATVQDVFSDYLKATTRRIRCKTNFDVFRAVQEASQLMPYDSAIVLMTSDTPNDFETQRKTLQTLMLKRCKLHLLWLDKTELPGQYFEAAQRTGGEVFELDDIDWLVNHTNNELEDSGSSPVTTTTESIEEDYFDPPQKVMIAVKRGVRDTLHLPIQVDSSISDLYITINGSVHKATLYLPNGAIKEIRLINTSRVSTDKLNGIWFLDVVGHNYNVTVEASSKLSYAAIVGQRNITIPSGKSIDVITLQGEQKLNKAVLIDETGKELTKLENIGSSYENSALQEHSGNITKEYNSVWQLPSNKLPEKDYYVQVFGEDEKGSKFTRLSSLRIGNYDSQQPITISLNEQSQISVTPGQTVTLYFDVANNYYQPIDMTFYTQDNLNFIKDINPKRQVVFPQTKTQVTIVLEIQTSSQQTIDLVTMTAQSFVGTVTSKTYLYIGYQRSDSSRPSVSYTTDGYCRDTLAPSVCYSNWWSVDATIQDDSGLMKIQSIPHGFQYKSEFIAGTRDKVNIHYTSTCCNTKVDIIAWDLNGNVRTRTIDIERVWLTAGEITAIVLGAVLAILIIFLIILSIVLCVRRRRQRNFLMHH